MKAALANCHPSSTSENATEVTRGQYTSLPFSLYHLEVLILSSVLMPSSHDIFSFIYLTRTIFFLISCSEVQILAYSFLYPLTGLEACREWKSQQRNLFSPQSTLVILVFPCSKISSLKKKPPLLPSHLVGGLEE